MACSIGRRLEVLPVPDQFPVGLRVLVVDDDEFCLRILEKMLRRCMYQVTSCSQAEVALNLLRERKGCFDLVLSDVHMPDMDGFKLLELVGLEMDLPVIMMSADGRTNLVLRGIQHGACDYLIKPIRDEELKNIWQHVVRKRWNEKKKHDLSGNTEDHDRTKREMDDGGCESSVNEGAEDAHKTKKKKRNPKDGDDTELENDDPNGAKKPRVVWSVELHQQFVTAVNQLGIEKAVPKRILELMNVPGLTRENVASHLQKFRLYLKRLSGISHQGGMPSFCGPMEENLKTASLERLDIHALAASGQLPAQTLAALQSELLSRSASNMMLLSRDPRPTAPPHASLTGSSCVSPDPGIAYGRPLLKGPSNVARQTLVCNENVSSEFTKCPPKNTSDVDPHGGLVTVNENNNGVMSFVQQLNPKQSSITVEPSLLLNAQPSCLVVPSLSPPYFQDGNGNGPDSLNRNFRCIDQIAGPAMEAECGILCSASELYTASSFSSVSSSSRNIQGGSSVSQLATPPWRIDPKTFIMNCEYGGSYNHEMSMVPSSMNPPPPSLAKRASIPSRFAVDEHELASSDEINAYKVKQEPNVDSATDSVRVGIPVGLKLPSSISMRVFSD